MSSISGMGNMGSMAALQGMHRRPDPSQMADKLFGKLDSTNQGYLQKSDFESAFSSISASTDVDTLFTQLDADSDGKVTQQEFSDSLTQLADQLDQQFQGMRMQQAMGEQGGMGGMPPPPPPPADDEGFTQEELSSQLEEIGSTDSKRSTLIANIVENFEAADADGNGKVSFKEAMAYDQSNSTGASTRTRTSTSTTATTSAGTAASVTDMQLFQQIMRLMQTYAIGAEDKQASSLTASA